MKRYVTLDDISDGRLYSGEDMVKTGCHGCEDCHLCCTGMGQSVIIQPLDIHRLSVGLHKTFEELVGTYIELGMADGLILPNIKMQPENDSCSFLNEAGRCSIHSFRPTFCRLFPLGIYYDENGLHYFLQTKECPAPSKTKVRIRQWLEESNMAAYETYTLGWHDFLEDCRKLLDCLTDENRRLLCTYILKFFYMTPYGNEFYTVFNERLKKISLVLEQFRQEA